MLETYNKILYVTCNKCSFQIKNYNYELWKLLENKVKENKHL
jgi:hypothetical protein